MDDPNWILIGLGTKDKAWLTVKHKINETKYDIRVYLKAWTQTAFRSSYRSIQVTTIMYICMATAAQQRLANERTVCMESDATAWRHKHMIIGHRVAAQIVIVVTGVGVVTSGGGEHAIEAATERSSQLLSLALVWLALQRHADPRMRRVWRQQPVKRRVENESIKFSC